LNVRLLTSTFEFINVEKPVSVLNLNSGQTVEYPLTEQHIIDGNGLTATVTTEDPSIVTGKAYSSESMKFTWSPNIDMKDVR
jgi:hypothetical protein